MSDYQIGNKALDDRKVSLRQYQQERGLTERDVYRMALQLAKTLMLAEEKGEVCRTVAPENIFVDQDGGFSFGIGCSKEETKDYMAPEVYRGEDYGNTAAIYSLGLVLYQALNRNCPPFLTPDDEHTELKREQALVERLSGRREMPAPAASSPDFAEVILKMCAFRPEDRYRDAKELVLGLEAVQIPEKPETDAAEAPGDPSPEGEQEGREDTQWERWNIVQEAGERPKIQNEVEIEQQETQEAEENEEPAKIENEENAYEKAQLELEEAQRQKRELRKKLILFVAVFAAVICAVLALMLLASRSYTLEVNGGSGSGTYKAGEEIEVEAETQEGKEFTGWEADGIELTDEELSAEKLVISMPRKTASLTATYRTSEYTVTVNNGSGSGTYLLNDEVEIVADAPEQGYAFDGWEVNAGTVELSDQKADRASFRIKGESVELTAIYHAVDYELLVNNGNGEGLYHFGDMVSISADPLRDGMSFSGWTVDRGNAVLSDPDMLNISFAMPAEDLTLTAHYMIQKYKLLVNNGRGNGLYDYDDEVTVTADAVNEYGMAFDSWSVTVGELDIPEDELKQNTLNFRMPKQDIELTANYKAVASAPAETTTPTAAGYQLTVNGGSGSGVYAAGEQVSVSHDPPQDGMKFAGWFVIGYEGSYDSLADTLTLTMPDQDVIVTATFVTQ